jgi:hypothetical protein
MFLTKMNDSLGGVQVSEYMGKFKIKRKTSKLMYVN